MSARRAGLAVVVLAAGGALAWAILTPGAPATDGTPTTVDAQPGQGDPGLKSAIGSTSGALTFTHPNDCRPCHEAVYLEWDESMHRKAWTDPNVRELSDDFKDTSCLSCHVPQPIHSGQVGSRVFERNSRFETGVDCLSCHLLPGGGVAASRDLPEAPCRPARVDTLLQPTTCNGCHNQHYLVDDWRDLFHDPQPEKGALLKEGRPETCVDCHMAVVQRTVGDATRPGRSHIFPGGHYPDMLRSGVTMETAVEGRTLNVTVTNSGTGHRAPADSRHRSFNVWVTVVTSGGVRVHDRKEIAEYRMYYRVPPRDNTNLRPGESSRSSLELPAGVTGKVTVELGYSLTPTDKEKKVFIPVHTRELPFDAR